MRNSWLVLAFSLLAGVVLAGTSATRVMADKRVALVVGNSNYLNIPALSNPTNDAQDIADKLKTLGFEVISGLNLDLQQWRAAWRS